MCSDSRRRLQNLSPSSFPSPTTMVTLKEQVALLTQQIQALQNQLSAWSPSPPVDPPPLPTTTKLPKITTLCSQVCKMTSIASRQSAACTYAYEGPNSLMR